MNTSVSDLSDLSIVIATLGGDNLDETIRFLNNGSKKPKRIYVCIPDPEFSLIEKILVDNVEYILSPCRGQVFQRTFAFKYVSSKYVLQIDDDVLISQDAMLELLSFLEERPLAAVSPSLLGRIDWSPTSFMSRPDSGIFNRILFCVANGKKGYEPGGISLSGINLGFDFTASSPYKVGWLPGGCILHNTVNLVNFNYYPFNGKAYSEDLIHSFLLNKSGVDLYHHPKVSCLYDKSSSGLSSIGEFVKQNYSVWRIMNYYSLMINSSRLRLFIFLFLNMIFTLINKVKRL